MYKKPDYAQTDIYDFILPFGGHLDEKNRWVILRRSIDWKIIHEVYEKNFNNKDTGNEALSAEIAFGSLYIQRKLSLTDRELVDQISENPYMQYFIGFKEFSTKRPFDPSLLVTFRKRLNAEMMEEISENPPCGGQDCELIPAMDTSDCAGQVKGTDRIRGEDIHIRGKRIHLYRQDQL